MSGPPSDISASQLWLKLSSAERPSKVVDFPRRDPVTGEPIGQVALRVLTQMEQMACSSEAEKIARTHIKDGKKDELGYERLYTDALCVEVLYRACRDVDDQTKPAFPTPKHLRESLTTEECGALFNFYLAIQLELGPMESKMSDEECEAWIDRLVEGGSAYPLELLASEARQVLMLYMAYQLRSSQMASSSAGTQLESSSSSSDEKLPQANE